MACRIDGPKVAVGERCSNGPARWRWTGQACVNLTDFNDVAHGKTLERKATKEDVLSHVPRTNRMAFCPEGVQHLEAPQAQGAGWATVMFQVTLPITKTTVVPDGKHRNRGFRHATFGCGVKRDDARFGDHWPHSA